MTVKGPFMCGLHSLCDGLFYWCIPNCAPRRAFASAIDDMNAWGADLLDAAPSSRETA